MHESLIARGKRFVLRHGEDVVMDNGACYQLITQTVFRKWHRYSVKLSKKEFNRFMKMNIVEIKKHGYGEGVRLYTYLGER